MMHKGHNEWEINNKRDCPFRVRHLIEIVSYCRLTNKECYWLKCPLKQSNGVKIFACRNDICSSCKWDGKLQYCINCSVKLNASNNYEEQT